MKPPRLSRRPRFPLIWVVPLVSLLIGGWLLFQEWHRRGPEITIEFADGAGIEPGRTVLQHQGVTVGRVSAVELTEDLQQVRVHLRLERSAAGLAREGSQFWVVQPQISLSRIEGLDTLFSGVRLNVRPGGGEPTSLFTGLAEAPAPHDVRGGRAFLLESPRLDGLSRGTSVLYRGLAVGRVEQAGLAPDARRVLLRIRIASAYADLVRPGSQFWRDGGLSLRLNLLGAEVNVGSLASLLSGSISFGTPDEAATLPPAGEGTRFVLHDEPEEAWLEWAPAIAIQPEPVAPAGEDAPVIGRKR